MLKIPQKKNILVWNKITFPRILNQEIVYGNKSRSGINSFNLYISETISTFFFVIRTACYKYPVVILIYAIIKNSSGSKCGKDFNVAKLFLECITQTHCCLFLLTFLMHSKKK